MRGFWGSYSQFADRTTSGLVSILFLSIGFLMVLLIPPNLRVGPDRGTLVLLIYLVGGLMVALGSFFLMGVLGDMYLGLYAPAFRPVWSFWYNFIGSLFAAALVAIPAALAFPVMFVGYLTPPNMLFPSNAGLLPNTLLMAWLFSVIGVTCLVFIISVGNEKYRSRPRTPRYELR